MTVLDNIRSPRVAVVAAPQTVEPTQAQNGGGYTNKAMSECSCSQKSKDGGSPSSNGYTNTMSGAIPNSPIKETKIDTSGEEAVNGDLHIHSSADVEENGNCENKALGEDP